MVLAVVRPSRLWRNFWFWGWELMDLATWKAKEPFLVAISDSISCSICSSLQGMVGSLVVYILGTLIPNKASRTSIS